MLAKGRGERNAEAEGVGQEEAEERERRFDAQGAMITSPFCSSASSEHKEGNLSSLANNLSLHYRTQGQFTCILLEKNRSRRESPSSSVGLSFWGRGDFCYSLSLFIFFFTEMSCLITRL